MSAQMDFGDLPNRLERLAMTGLNEPSSDVSVYAHRITGYRDGEFVAEDSLSHKLRKSLWNRDGDMLITVRGRVVVPHHKLSPGDVVRVEIVKNEGEEWEERDESFFQVNRAWFDDDGFGETGWGSIEVDARRVEPFEAVDLVE